MWPADVRELFGSMRKTEKSTSQIKKTRAALSAMFATAVDDGLLRSNPDRRGPHPPAPAGESADRKPKALTRRELSTLLAAIDEDWRLFFEFLAQTGLRISEAIGLTWAHIDAPVFPSKAGTELLPANVYRRVLAPAAIGLGMYVEIATDGPEDPHRRSTVSFHAFSATPVRRCCLRRAVTSSKGRSGSAMQTPGSHFGLTCT